MDPKWDDLSRGWEKLWTPGSFDSPPRAGANARGPGSLRMTASI